MLFVLLEERGVQPNPSVQAGGHSSIIGLTRGIITIKIYFCHNCAEQRGFIEHLPIGKVIKTPYQYSKYRKHTELDSDYSIQSVFSDPSTSVYADYIVNAMLEGAVEIDELGRKNIIWCAGKPTGFQYKAGHIIRPTDAVKVVLSSAEHSIHIFPDNSTCFNTGVCHECGNPIVF